jgi:hypothetical protein
MTSCHVQVQTYEANWLKMLMASFTKSFVNLQCIMDLVVNSCLHNIFYISYNHASFQKKKKKLTMIHVNISFEFLLLIIKSNQESFDGLGIKFLFNSLGSLICITKIS